MVVNIEFVVNLSKIAAYDRHSCAKTILRCGESWRDLRRSARFFICNELVVSVPVRPLSLLLGMALVLRAVVPANPTIAS